MPDDIDLDAPPPVTNRQLLSMAAIELGSVVRYGLHAITDDIDREHLKNAHRYLRMVLDGGQTTGAGPDYTGGNL